MEKEERNKLVLETATKIAGLHSMAEHCGDIPTMRILAEDIVEDLVRLDCGYLIVR
jgi:hypothetical protein